MKKLTLITLLTALCFTASAQSKKQSVFNSSNWIMTDTISTSGAGRPLYFATPTWKPMGFVFTGINKEVLNISAPDSTKTITVRFSKSQVKFINDSTFTFKQKQ